MCRHTHLWDVAAVLRVLLHWMQAQIFWGKHLLKSCQYLIYAQSLVLMHWLPVKYRNKIQHRLAMSSLCKLSFLLSCFPLIAKILNDFVLSQKWREFYLSLTTVITKGSFPLQNWLAATCSLIYWGDFDF